MKLRVHELAKKYAVKNKEFLEILNTEIGIEVTSHLANLDETQIEKVEEYYSRLSKAEEKEEKKIPKANKGKEKQHKKNIPIILEEEEEEVADRKSTRLNSSHANISYAVFCLKNKNISFFTSSFLLTSSS